MPLSDSLVRYFGEQVLAEKHADFAGDHAKMGYAKVEKRESRIHSVYLQHVNESSLADGAGVLSGLKCSHGAGRACWGFCGGERVAVAVKKITPFAVLDF